jgi:hypothetical protein
MAGTANKQLIATHEGMVGVAHVPTTANTGGDLTAAGSTLLFTAQATTGSHVRFVRFKVTASTTAGTEVRLWHATNTAALATVGNNMLVGSVVVPILTVAGTLSIPGFDVRLDRFMPPDDALYITTTVAHGGVITAIAIGGRL